MRPLDGITVITLEHAIAAPFCTRQLADLGARVIKIERPGSGDFARDYDTRVRGLASHFVWTNRSKESVSLDVKHPETRTILARLLEGADVFVQNLAPGAAARLGLCYDELSAKYPKLIVCDISGYGSDGPYADKKAYDLLIFYAFEGASPPKRTGAAHATIYPYGPFQAGDGRLVMFGLQNEREWAVFCDKVLGQPALATDPRFASNSARTNDRAALDEVIHAALATMTAAEVVARLDASGIANARINDIAEVWQHPQLAPPAPSDVRSPRPHRDVTLNRPAAQLRGPTWWPKRSTRPCTRRGRRRARDRPYPSTRAPRCVCARHAWALSRHPVRRPVKAAEAIIAAVDSPQPPVHLLLGSDAAQRAPEGW
jgi:crotonobetainyl-CoA:carnitine CoA-transferase CaiB-like acyl-CoA transferase